MTSLLKIKCKYCGCEMVLDDYDSDGVTRYYSFVCEQCKASVSVTAEMEWEPGEEYRTC